MISSKRLLRSRSDEFTVGAGWDILAELTDNLFSECSESDDAENTYKTIHALVEFARLLCSCNPVSQFGSLKREVLHSLEKLLGTLPASLEEHAISDLQWIFRVQTTSSASLKEMCILSLRNALRCPISRNVERVLLGVDERIQPLLRTQILREDILGISDRDQFYDVIKQ